MNLVRHRGLPALLGLALTVAAVAVATPAHADGEPVATYKLDSTSIWTGQQVKLTESDLTADAEVTRTIAWGDGTTTEAAAAAVWSHTYATAGSYPVTVTLNDGTLSGPGTFPASSTVGVVASPGTYGWKQPTVYTYPGYQNVATMTATGIPAATRVWTGWGDGETSLLGGTTSATAPHWFGAGTWTPSITLQNAQGKATPRATSRLSVLTDITNPTATVTIPGSPHRGSSWSQIKGKARDSQSGPDEVGVRLWRWKSSSDVDYMFDFATRKWLVNKEDMPATTWAYLPVDAAGNWHFYTSGLTKGWNFELDYYVMDKVGNHTALDGDYIWYSLTS